VSYFLDGIREEIWPQMGQPANPGRKMAVKPVVFVILCTTSVTSKLVLAEFVKQK